MKAKSQVIFSLTAAFVIFLMAMTATIIISGRKLREEAFDHARNEQSEQTRYLSAFFLTSSWSVNTFLTAYTDIELGQSGYEVDHFAREGNARRYRGKDVVASMTSLLSYYDCLNSASLIIKPGVLPLCPDGYAVTVDREGFEKHNLFDYGDVFSSPLYLSLQNEPVFTVSQLYEGREKEWLYSVPFSGDDGEFMGLFIVTISMDYVDNFLKDHKYQDDMALAIMDSSGNLLSLTADGYRCENLTTVLCDTFGQEVGEIIGGTIMLRLKSGNMDPFDTEYGSQAARIYVSPIKGTQFYYVSVKSEGRVLKSAHRIIGFLFCLAIISVILFSVCLLFAFKRYQKENLENQRMEGELEIASGIQRSFLPQNPSPGGVRLPDNVDVFGYQKSAKSVGGDLYDYLVQDDKLYFCIGDVSGKGVPAALLMSEICSLFRYVTRQFDNPQEIVTAINGSATDSSEDRMICSMFVGILDLKTGMLDYCNAAHNPPILLSGGVARYMKMKANLPVFAYDEYPYKKASLQLSKGDRLVLYTDGVTEAKDSNNNFFGSQRTLELVKSFGEVSLQEAVRGIQERLSAFSGDSGQYDDITMLLIEYD